MFIFKYPLGLFPTPLNSSKTHFSLDVAAPLPAGMCNQPRHCSPALRACATAPTETHRKCHQGTEGVQLISLHFSV